MPGLVDHLGRPVQTAALKNTQGAAEKSGPRAWSSASVAKGLTPEKLAGIFDKADKGDLRELVRLAAELEERDAHAGAQLRTRKLALAALEWRVEAASDDPKDVALAEELQALVDGPLWQPLVVDCMDAVNKPFAMIEIVWRTGPQWTVAALEWRDPSHFAVDENDGTTLRLRTQASPDVGEELVPWKWIRHSPATKSGPLPRRGLCRTLAVLYSIKTLGVSAWTTFVELFGVPPRIGKYAPGTDEGQIQALEDAVAALGTDAYGVMPNTMQIDFPSLSKGGDGAPHEKLCKWVEEQASKAILGQAEATERGGGSLAKAEVSERISRDILVADARALTATLQRDLICPYVEINYGPRETAAEYPRLICNTDEPEDLAAFTAAALPWVQAGVTVESSVIRDKFRWPAPAEAGEGGKPVEVVGGKGSAPAEAPTPPEGLSRSRRQLAVEDGDDFIDRDLAPDDWRSAMGPLREGLAKAAREAKTFGEFLTKVEALTVDGDALVKSLAAKMLVARGVGDATDEVDL